MNRSTSTLALLAMVLFSATAAAEYRVVLIQLKRDKETTKVSIYSDVKEDLKQEVSIAEAVPVIAEIKGWGSGVGVYVTYTTNIPGGELRKILVPVCENHTLDLISYGKAADLPERIKQALVK